MVLELIGFSSSENNIINLSDDEEFPDNFVRRRRPPMEDPSDHDNIPPPPPIGPELAPDSTLVRFAKIISSVIAQNLRLGTQLQEGPLEP